MQISTYHNFFSILEVSQCIVLILISEHAPNEQFDQIQSNLSWYKLSLLSFEKSHCNDLPPLYVTNQSLN